MQTEISRLISETVVALFQANGKMLEWGDAFTAPFGVSRQGAQKQLNLLADDGLIEKLPNPSHQRSPHYHLTEKGRLLFVRVDLAWQAHADKASEAFSTQDLEITLRTLSLISRIHGVAIQGEHDET